MRICVLHVPAGSSGSLEAAAKAMARALQTKGHEVDLVSGAKGETPRFASADYLIVATEPLGFAGKLPPRLGEILGQSPGASGKRSMALVLKRGPFRNKTITRLMKAMEAEGMTVNDEAVVSNAREAAAAAADAPVERIGRG
ncbi:MAG TPA: hypothetical protein VMV44_09455 [Rectinemataceae bacterium]|nr:hypothetical protein [Rectinemataceae bacterium]